MKTNLTKDEALDFLRQHQPLPDDEERLEQLIGMFDEVRRYFTEHPDPESIPLFLHAFSDSMGLGVYQVCDSVFRNHDVID